MQKTAVWITVMNVVCVLGCGDDSGETPDSIDGSAEGGMEAGEPMSDAAAITTTTPPANTNINRPPPVVCGDRTCAVPGQSLLDQFAGLASGLGLPIGGIASGLLPMACCDEDDACGLVAMTDGGSMCVPPPASDPRCPDVDFLGMPTASCCIEEMGICGINTAQYGGGCVEPLGGVLAELLGTTPTACMGDAAVADAAVMDATVQDAATDDEDSAVRDDEDAGF